MKSIDIQLGGRHGSKISGYTLVDAIDSDLASLNWCKNSAGYAMRGNSKGGKVLLHRVIMGRHHSRDIGKGEDVDHINHNSLDNRRENLRVTTHSQNLQNRNGPNKNNTSGYRGASFHKQTGKWRATIGDNIHVGMFPTAQAAGDAAAEARQEAGFLTSQA